MKTKFSVIMEFEEEKFKDFAISAVKSYITDIVKSLEPFNIKPEKEPKIETTLNARFKVDEETNITTSVMGARGIQYVVGLKRDFVRAIKSGVIPKNALPL